MVGIFYILHNTIVRVRVFHMEPMEEWELAAMNQKKFFLKSKTVWGLIIVAAPQIALLFGFEWGPEDNANLASVGNSIASLAGVVLAYWGRKTATEGITITGE